MSLSDIDDPKAFEAAFYGKHGITPAEALNRMPRFDEHQPVVDAMADVIIDYACDEAKAKSEESRLKLADEIVSAIETHGDVRLLSAERGLVVAHVAGMLLNR